MTRLQEIETAIESLNEDEYTALREWFLERDWARWDRQIEADSASGRLDGLVSEAVEAKQTETLGSL